MDGKPRLFVGSSLESLNIAEAVHSCLDHDVEVSIWRSGTFKLSSNTLDDLLEKTISVDFSLFIFSPDDIANIRGDSEPVARDNVIFELGLFIGSLGKERCFILKPRNTEMHLPSDLIGLNTVDFEANRSDGDLSSAVTHACVQMKKSMKENSTLKDQKNLLQKRKNIDSNLTDMDFELLILLLGTATEFPEGYTLDRIQNRLKSQSKMLNVSLLKLEKFGMVQRTVMVDDYNNTFVVFNITQDGVDHILNHEDKVKHFQSYSYYQEKHQF